MPCKQSASANDSDILYRLLRRPLIFAQGACFIVDHTFAASLDGVEIADLHDSATVAGLLCVVNSTTRTTI
jgi:hypothetical protein